MYKSLICFALLLIASGLYLLVGLNYPKSWNKIKNGTPRSQVKDLCGDLQTGLHDIKGDFCGSEMPLIRWSLQILYDDHDLVHDAHLTLFLGTKTTFKSIYIRNLAAV